MIKITLKDGSVKELAAPQSIADFTKDLSMGLYRNACCALVDGKVADLCDLLDHDCAVEILTFEDEQGQRAFNHTASHILAQAVQHLFPGAKLAIGPAIEDGFYYDFDVPTPFTPEDLEKLEAEMAAIAKQDLPIERFSLPVEEAKKLMADQPYKLELIEEHAGKGEAIAFRRQGDFTDLCAGPHLMSTGPVKAVKLTSCTGAYWRGSEKNKMLSRVYGCAFPKRSMLEEHLARLEEARRRGITLLHENEKHIYGDIPERCLDLVKNFYGDNFKVTFDPANFVQCQVQVYPHAYELLAPYIAYLHIKDAYLSDGHVTVAGRGDGSVKEVLTRLSEAGFSGYLSLEPHLTNFVGFSDLEADAASQVKEDAGMGAKLFAAAAHELRSILKTL